MATPEDVAAFHQLLRPDSLRQKLCLVVLCAATTTPAMDLSGFGDLLPDWPLAVWVVLSAMVGALVGFAYYPQWRYGLVGVLPGMLAGPCVLLLTYFYTLPRETVYRAEMALVWVVGMVPAALFYYVAMRLVVLSTSRPSQSIQYSPGPWVRPTEPPLVSPPSNVPVSSPPTDAVPHSALPSSAFPSSTAPLDVTPLDATLAHNPAAPTAPRHAAAQPVGTAFHPAPRPAARPGRRWGLALLGVGVGCGGFVALLLLGAIGSLVLDRGARQGPPPVEQFGERSPIVQPPTMQPPAVQPPGLRPPEVKPPATRPNRAARPTSQPPVVPAPTAALGQQELDEVVAKLKSGDRRSQRAAVQRLTETRPDNVDQQAAAAALVDFMAVDDFVVRRSAAEALRNWGTPESVPGLIAALDHDDFVLRRHAMQALGQLGDARAAEPLVQRLSKGTDRTYAATALRTLGAAGETAVMAAFESTDVLVRSEACRILGDIGTEQCVTALEAAAQDKLVASAARQALTTVRARQK